jgi:hypothetical protein
MIVGIVIFAELAKLQYSVWRIGYSDTRGDLVYLHLAKLSFGKNPLKMPLFKILVKKWI